MEKEFPSQIKSEHGGKWRKFRERLFPKIDGLSDGPIEGLIKLN